MLCMTSSFSRTSKLFSIHFIEKKNSPWIYVKKILVTHSLEKRWWWGLQSTFSQKLMLNRSVYFQAAGRLPRQLAAEFLTPGAVPFKLLSLGKKIEKTGNIKALQIKHQLAFHFVRTKKNMVNFYRVKKGDIILYYQKSIFYPNYSQLIDFGLFQSKN